LKWEYNIKMNFIEIRYQGVDWIQFAHDRAHWRDVMNALMNLRVSFLTI